jgi:methylenetetrahydrofolate reductase (NADPH)
MVKRLIASKLVPGVHFCTLNLEKSVRTVLENLGWQSHSNGTPASPGLKHNKVIEEDEGFPIKHGSNEPAGLSMSPSDASHLAEWGLTHAAQPPAPKRNTGPEDSWDEYPNGRFTDVRSPAYGEIDGWGSGLKITVS